MIFPVQMIGPSKILQFSIQLDSQGCDSLYTFNSSVTIPYNKESFIYISIHRHLEALSIDHSSWIYYSFYIYYKHVV